MWCMVIWQIFTIICLISANFEEFSKPLPEVLLKFGIVSCKETTKASKNDREYLKQFKRLTFDIFFKPILSLYASPIVSLASSSLLVRIFWLTVWPIRSWFLLSPRTSSQQAHHSHILSSAQAQHHPDYIQFNIKETIKSLFAPSSLCLPFGRCPCLYQLSK